MVREKEVWNGREELEGEERERNGGGEETRVRRKRVRKVKKNKEESLSIHEVKGREKKKRNGMGRVEGRDE